MLVTAALPLLCAAPPSCTPPLKTCGANCQFGATCASGYDLSAAGLCNETAGCTATGVRVSTPAFEASPSYSWSISATLPGTVTSPAWAVDVVISHPHAADHGLNEPFGADSGSACGKSIAVGLGTGQKGNKSPVYCPGCQVALHFPACPWAAGSQLRIGVDFTMGYFIVPGLDMPNTTVTVTGDKGERLLAARSLADLVAAAPPPPPPPAPPAQQLYTCKANKCVAAAAGVPKPACETVCGAA